MKIIVCKFSLKFIAVGNIKSQSWRQSSKTRKYDFTYDNLSRLTAANYTSENTLEKYNTSYAYDKHGNMMTIQRGGLVSGTTFNTVDNLALSYVGNQLNNVHDTGTKVSLSTSTDFKDYSVDATKTKKEYSYNQNGAMTQDLNKGITTIQYNSLNLPTLMGIKSPVGEARNEYTYSASGQKLKVVQKWNPAFNTNPIIGSAVNVSSLTTSLTTDYVGNKIYENGTLKRILIVGGYIEGGKYHYYLTDHLGNNRAVAEANGTIIQQTQFYPFGMAFAESAGGEKQPYKYNNKELDTKHGLNMYDYSARYLDIAVPRFTSVDPLAEKYYSWSPYVYVGNNPLKYIDPDGRQVRIPFGLNFNQVRTGVYNQQGQKAQAGVTREKVVAELLTYTDINDVAVLTTTATRRGTAINVDGTPATTVDKIAAGAGLVLPVVSGSAVVKVGKKLGLGDKSAKALKEVDIPALDSTGKVHGDLPSPSDLKNYSKEDLKVLQDQLGTSVEKRIERTTELGSDKGHGVRQNQEQDLIKSIDKHLENR